MRACAFVLAASLALSGAAEAAPKRVASLNLCTDELLLTLAAPEQIDSVTYLSHLSKETMLWREARRYRRNDATILSVAPRKPDLILTMGGGGRDRIGIAKRLGIPVLDVPLPQTLGEVEANIRNVAAALGQPQAGERVLRLIRSLKNSAQPPLVDTVWLGGGGRSVSAKGVVADWMALAGFRQRALPGDRLSLEQLLVAPPRVLLRSDYRQGQYSMEQRWLSHPLASRARKSRTIATDGRRWSCGGPSLIPEILRLRRELQR